MVNKEPHKLLVTDCGSTTSKARLFKKIKDEWRYIASGEAPTTVEAPYEDVTLGIRNAVRELEEITNITLLSEDGIIQPSKGENEGVDLYFTTSSAGGGLQMSVIGVIKTITAESAERAALGAGAIIMDTVAVDDGRELYQKIELLRSLRPDMILFAGGTDGGTSSHIIDLSNLLKIADPKPRLGISYTLPLVYAGNKFVQHEVKRILDNRFALEIVDNLRPKLGSENTIPAREAIHHLFMEHVMSHAPGYDKLMTWTEIPIMPTPMAEGMGFQLIAKMNEENVIGVGLGGATTNIYSVYDGRFVRSVSANLGMSYSICNVLKQAGDENILRWIPYEIGEENLLESLYNKMIRPTTIPQTLRELLIEHAVAREALRMGLIQHQQLAKPLVGLKRDDTDVSTLMEWMDAQKQTYIDMLKVGSIGGTGGLLSHAPRRIQSMLVLIDGFAIEGVVKLYQDSVFMMPHLGIVSTKYPEIALEIFEKDCLVKLGTCIAFSGSMNGTGKVGEVTLKLPNDNTLNVEVEYGKMNRIKLDEGQSTLANIKPTNRFDVGAGRGRAVEKKLEGGVCGIVIDGRGRPLNLPTDHRIRREKILDWFKSLDAYPSEILNHLVE